MTLPSAAFPEYDGVRSETGITVFAIDPPVAVSEGDLIDMVFRTTAGIGTSGIWMKDVDPNSAMVFYNGQPGLPEPVRWDFMARIRVH